jgi:hypothetical protein
VLPLKGEYQGKTASQARTVRIQKLAIINIA